MILGGHSPEKKLHNDCYVAEKVIQALVHMDQGFFLNTGTAMGTATALAVPELCWFIIPSNRVQPALWQSPGMERLLSIRAASLE